MMLTTGTLTDLVPAPPSRSKLGYVYLLRVPLTIGVLFAILPFIALRTRAASLFLGLFDVSGVAVWAVSTSAFTLSLTLMTTWFLVLAYADQRCAAGSFKVKYPIRKGWYAVAA